MKKKTAFIISGLLSFVLCAGGCRKTAEEPLPTPIPKSATELVETAFSSFSDESMYVDAELLVDFSFLPTGEEAVDEYGDFPGTKLNVELSLKRDAKAAFIDGNFHIGFNGLYMEEEIGLCYERVENGAVSYEYDSLEETWYKESIALADYPKLPSLSTDLFSEISFLPEKDTEKTKAVKLAAVNDKLVSLLEGELSDEEEGESFTVNEEFSDIPITLVAHFDKATDVLKKVEILPFESDEAFTYLSCKIELSVNQIGGGMIMIPQGIKDTALSLDEEEVAE